MLQAQIASQMNVAQLNVDQQRAVQNASMVANMDMAQFSAEQQVALANSKFMQSMTMTDLNNRQQAVIQNATAMAQLDLTNANNRTKLAAQNAQAFLQMDLTVLYELELVLYFFPVGQIQIYVIFVHYIFLDHLQQRDKQTMEFFLLFDHLDI